MIFCFVLTLSLSCRQPGDGVWSRSVALLGRHRAAGPPGQGQTPAQGPHTGGSHRDGGGRVGDIALF